MIPSAGGATPVSPIRRKRNSCCVQHQRSPKTHAGGISSSNVGLRRGYLQKIRHSCPCCGRDERSHSSPTSNSSDIGVGQGGSCHQIELFPMGERGRSQIRMAAGVWGILREQFYCPHGRSLHTESSGASQKIDVR